MWRQSFPPLGRGPSPGGRVAEARPLTTYRGSACPSATCTCVARSTKAHRLACPPLTSQAGSSSSSSSGRPTPGRSCVRAEPCRARCDDGVVVFVDGAPYCVEELVYGRAGLVVGFRLSRRVVMRRVITRSLRESLGWVPAPQGDRRWRAWLNREHPVRWAWSTWADRDRELVDLIDEGLADRAGVVSLSTPRGVTAWLEQRADAGWSLRRSSSPEPERPAPN